ncbi:polyadenylate-binding protein-interacting protein 1 isoform X1 [Notechis scutatus]|uniref:Polyadenylate-binding protein-interacting protein 1 n=2 Tax=Notechis scutatus TaxID=8663 RepID=A0A6J1U313_9SAUR|nr:polyadenylate-binding protein-interacting protein 1 isoform X1 [Notechis scutatus]
MSDNGFDRAPGAGRGRGGGAPLAPESGVRGGGGGGGGTFGTPEPLLKQGFSRPQEPLRPPKTAPPGANNAAASEPARSASLPASFSEKKNPGSAVTKPQVVVAPVVMSKLSVNAPEFYPSGYTPNHTESSLEDDCDGYPTPTEYVQDFLNHLAGQPACFETEIAHFSETLNGCMTTYEALQELVELLYQQATSVPNFSYIGARLCNYLSLHLTINPQNGNFRTVLLSRCQKEFENRDGAAKGDDTVRKRFHAFVLFLAELYLNLEIKGNEGQLTRAEILQTGLQELLNTLFSNPLDSNLICAVKLLKLTGSVLEDAWKEKGKTYMDDIIQKIENVVLDANCSRDVKHMLLKLVELRSSNWGRVHIASTYREATPENDPNYFMNEPTFYTSEGLPFTAADPDYQEKYQELLERQDLFQGYEENGTGAEDQYFDDEDDDEKDDEMDPEIEEAYEKFCLESERKRKQ